MLAAAAFAAVFEAPVSASTLMLDCESCEAVVALACDPAAAAPLPLAEFAFALLLLDVPDVVAFAVLPADACEPKKKEIYKKFVCFWLTIYVVF